ncbi:hypothetical protein Ae168Ps1_1560c [Pseudonocardia sp. Ae168_Ps1]|uniref:hypothetical protein n=1 Tax=unclassified Pseudonocardia TaxID=2619320 RepID=UPI0001FFF048|nr:MULTISPECIES: hypothetical protein [unclassified Pseudonocardia]OLL73177.1 hypothetical protein Ae150APs1_1555c [Pseudonocardia sp. Ae150A_Ps1]OLL79154.1 hypothetical protein Ae168Ps1_1560c [Pseudonocardia sp. Ae168_Ps1]OLL86709.1 hypothetical protein Ae263Ps1_3764 [Pseudonocardia sp. Ae263_Ps1]OLL93245.1 hypothetical protein Ae356Ps1_3142c [Pseudonocardia sp. Ae356_Ps1]
MRTIIDAWDAFELWLTQLPFVFQTVFVTVVVLPLCALVAIGIDRATRRFDRAPDQES